MGHPMEKIVFHSEDFLARLEVVLLIQNKARASLLAACEAVRKQEIVGVFVIEHARHTSELKSKFKSNGARAQCRLSLAKVGVGDEVADASVPRPALRASFQVQGVKQVEETSANL